MNGGHRWRDSSGSNWQPTAESCATAEDPSLVSPRFQSRRDPPRSCAAGKGRMRDCEHLLRSEKRKASPHPQCCANLGRKESLVWGYTNNWPVLSVTIRENGHMGHAGSSWVVLPCLPGMLQITHNCLQLSNQCRTLPCQLWSTSSGCLRALC